ncbi:hypothetical protein KR074_008785 [Drosophila pseudoananassae]|nr:hypothetical protein KR074_008785 [Drosophila pseudoananassae]
MRQEHFICQVSLAVFILCACLAPATCLYETTILNFLDEFKKRMCHPIPNLGLPALDPLEIKHAEAAVDGNYLVDFTGSIDNFQLHGLSDFEVPELTLRLLRTSTINVTLPLAYLNSTYTAKGSLAYILNLAGDGDAEASIKDFSVLITFIVSNISPIRIRSLDIQLHLGDLKIHFESLLEEERVNDFIHALVNEMGVELLGDIWDYGQGTVIDKVQTAINNFLGQFSLTDIIGIITGGGEGEESAPIFDGVEPDCKPEASSRK